MGGQPCTCTNKVLVQNLGSGTGTAGTVSVLVFRVRAAGQQILSIQTKFRSKIKNVTSTACSWVHVLISDLYGTCTRVDLPIIIKYLGGRSGR